MFPKFYIEDEKKNTMRYDDGVVKKQADVYILYTILSNNKEQKLEIRARKEPKTRREQHLSKEKESQEATYSLSSTSSTVHYSILFCLKK